MYQKYSFKRIYCLYRCYNFSPLLNKNANFHYGNIKKIRQILPFFDHTKFSTLKIHIEKILPYAASANYINRMSDYCQGCKYNQKDRTGEKACPFNFFYWDFLIRHQDKLRSLGRMNLVLSHLKKISPEESEQIRFQARQWWKREN